MTGRQAGFVVELTAACRPDEALRRVLDLRVHDWVIPLTSVTPAVGPDDLGTGFRFVARTSLGRVGFDDAMVVEAISFEPQAAARITKLGRVIHGRIRVSARAVAGESRLRWEQTVHLPWLPEFLQPLAAKVLRLGYRAILRRLIAASPPSGAGRQS